MRSFLYFAAALLPLAIAAPITNDASTAASQAGKTGYHGDITYYSPSVGLGSCGVQSSDSEAVVALAVPMMNNGANPNTNPLCGQHITLSYQGKRHKAKIVDTCQACAFSDVDLSPTLFKKVAPDGNGRLHNIHWWFDSTADGERP